MRLMNEQVHVPDPVVHTPEFRVPLDAIFFFFFFFFKKESALAACVKCCVKLVTNECR